VGIRGLHGWEATQAAARLSGWEGGDREGGEEEVGRPRAEGGQAPTGLGRGGLDRLGRVGEGNRKRCLWSLAAELDEFKRFKRILNPNKGLNFLINKNLTLVQGLKSSNFEIQIKHYLDFKQRALDQGELNLTQDFEFKGWFEYFQRTET
jgi:hypothetical protein